MTPQALYCTVYTLSHDRTHACVLCVCVCVCVVCVCVCVCGVCVCVCVCVVCVVCVHVCVQCVFMHTHMYSVCVCSCVFVCVLYACIQTYVRMFVRRYVHIVMCMHVHRYLVPDRRLGKLPRGTPHPNKPSSSTRTDIICVCACQSSHILCTISQVRCICIHTEPQKPWK